MREWLTIELALGTLLVTSFTTVGLLALWAATSRFHWFLRLAAGTIVLTPLLVIFAYELLMIFVFQSIVVVGVLALARWKPWRKQSWNWRLFSLSLGDGMLGIAVVALSLAIGVRISDEAWHSTPQILLVGATFAVTTLTAAWLVFGRPTFWRRVLPAAAFVLFVTLPIACLNDWPNAFTDTLTLDDFQNWSPFQTPPFVTEIWLGIVPATAATIAGVLLLVRARRQTPTRLRAASSAAVAVALAMIAFPPAVVTWKLAHPAAIPVADMPTPNGYDDLVRGGEMIQSGSPMLNTVIEPKSTQDLAAEIAKFTPAYESIRLGLSRQCKVNVFPADGELEFVLDTDEMGHLRAAARAIMRDAELAQRENRYRNAAKISIENIRLGQAATRGGLMVNYLVGVAIEGIGHSTLVTVIDQLDRESCREAIVGLESAEQAREPLPEIFARERIWSENAYGWVGHLMELLDDIARPSRSNMDIIADSVLPRTQAVARLLIVQSALRQYQLEHDEFPRDLDQLVPKYLKSVPRDPFAQNEQPLRYQRLDERYLLYSVAFDGDDDEGQLRSNAEFDWERDGDLSLETHFWEELQKAGAVTSSSDGEEMGLNQDRAE